MSAVHLDTEILNLCHYIVALSVRVIYHNLIMNRIVPIMVASVPRAKVLWRHKLHSRQPLVQSNPCPSITDEQNPRMSQFVFAEFALLLTSCEFGCSGASLVAEALSVLAAEAAPAAGCRRPNPGAGGSTVVAGGAGWGPQRDLPNLKYWDHHGNSPN